MTFADFVAAIQNEVNDLDANMKTRIEGWTNDLHHYICSLRRWQWLVTTSAATVIKTGAHPVTFASLTPAIRSILDVVDTSYDPNQPLIPTTEDSIRAQPSIYTSNTGSPYWWYVTADANLYVYPLPDTTGRNYTIRYVAKATTLGTGSTTALLVPDRWITVLKDGVLKKAYSWLDKESKATRHSAEFLKGIEEMKLQDGENQQIIYPNPDRRHDIFPEEIVYP